MVTSRQARADDRLRRVHRAGAGPHRQFQCRCRSHPAATVRCSGTGAADCMRQCRGAAAGPRSPASGGVCRAHRARRPAACAVSSGLDREPSDRPARRRAWCGARVRDRQGLQADRRAGHSAARRGDGSWPVLASGLGLAIVGALVAGFLPAFRASRLDAMQVLKSAGPKSSAGRRERRLLRAVTIGQTALTLALLVGAGLLLRTTSNLSRVQSGYDIDQIVTMTVTAVQGDWNNFHTLALERVSSLSGVQGAAFAWGVPLTGNNWPGRSRSRASLRSASRATPSRFRCDRSRRDTSTSSGCRSPKAGTSARPMPTKPHESLSSIGRSPNGTSPAQRARQEAVARQPPAAADGDRRGHGQQPHR